MTAKTKLERLAEHYDNTDTTTELEEVTAPAGSEASLSSSERMTTFAVRLPVAVLDQVRAIAEQRHVTTSSLIRRWLDAGIAEDGRDAGSRVVSVQALLELIGRAAHRDP